MSIYGQSRGVLCESEYVIRGTLEMYVCMHVCMYVCKYVCTYVRMYVFI